MINKKSLKAFNKVLNVVILLLAIICIVLMLNLVKKEYFSNKNNNNANNNATNNNAANNNAANNNAANNNATNNTANNNPLIKVDININKIGNKIGNKIEYVEEAIMDLIIPEGTTSTVSNINAMKTTPVTLVNNTLQVDGTTSALNKNNTIFNTQNSINNKNSEQNKLTRDYQNMLIKVLNFLEYPDEQKYCPNMDDSEAAFWVQLPEDYAGEHYAKFCCTNCYKFVAKEIYCGENQNGLFVLDNFSVNDLAKLRELYDSELEAFDRFPFPEVKLNSLLGQPVLKMLFDEDYYTIQVIKSGQALIEHEPDAAISKELYQSTFNCPAGASKPVLQLIDI